MKKTLYGGRLALALGIVLLTAVACQGRSTGTPGYVPIGTSNVATPQMMEAKIISSCGTKIRIVLLGSVECKFHENNHPLRTFTLVNHTNGLVSISPSSGTKLTTFTVTAILLGSGYFTVKDADGNQLNVKLEIVT